MTISFWGQTFVEEEKEGTKSEKEKGRASLAGRDSRSLRKRHGRRRRETNETIVEIREIVQPFRGTFHTFKIHFRIFTMAVRRAVVDL